MTAPPDPLRHSFTMSLPMTDAQAAERRRLRLLLSEAGERAAQVPDKSQEQIDTAAREQADAADALDDFWRRMAAEHVPGAREELAAWTAWAATGMGRAVRIDLGTTADAMGTP